MDDKEDEWVKVLEQEPARTEKAVKEQEAALNGLGELYKGRKDAQRLGGLVRESRHVMAHFPKAKTAKVIRSLLDCLSTTAGTTEVQIGVTRECIEWAVQEKRGFLRLNLQTRLVALYLEKPSYAEALALINTLLKELKRLDDKVVLVEVQLLESKAYHALRNLPKSKAALTSARTSANAVYCPPLLQASLDLQSGILHADDKDFQTAHSYFVEALDGYSSHQDPRAVSALKYMLLSKIMLNLTDDTQSILGNKMAVKYAGRDIDAMAAVARAYENRSLSEFETALENFKQELRTDPIIRTHFTALYDSLLEQNLVRVIEPFSKVEVAHVAEVVGLSLDQVEGKLSQMILDKVFYGVIDQGAGCLIVFDKPKEDKTYDAALETIKHLSTVVDLLYEKASTAA